MGVLASPVLLQGVKLNALLPDKPGCQYEHIADIAELAERARRFFLQQRSWLGHVTLSACVVGTKSLRLENHK